MLLASVPTVALPKVAYVSYTRTIDATPETPILELPEDREWYDLVPPRLSLIVGENNAGKTSIINAAIDTRLKSRLRFSPAERTTDARSRASMLRGGKPAERLACPAESSAAFRRTAVRNLERGRRFRRRRLVMVGHLTESVYTRYAISDRASLRESENNWTACIAPAINRSDPPGSERSTSLTTIGYLNSSRSIMAWKLV